jgi:hypothetical protein
VCSAPMLVLPDGVVAHPLQVSIDIASLAPNAEITVFPRKDPPELKARTINRAQLPEAARAGVSAKSSKNTKRRRFGLWQQPVLNASQNVRTSGRRPFMRALARHPPQLDFQA